jgi:type II secretory pathway predicted ATPase ExeA
MFKHAGRRFRVMPDSSIQKLTFDQSGAPKWVGALATEALMSAAIAKATGEQP